MRDAEYLPDPWREVEVLPPEQQDALEAVVGSQLTYADLTPDDVDEQGDMKRPKSKRSMYVMGHRWVRVQNVDTDAEVLLRLQSERENSSVRVSSVIFPFEPARELAGADLRGLPIAALNAAYSKREQEGTARLQIMLALDGHAPDALDPLPRGNASDRFSALVARQFMRIEEEDEKVNVAKKMSELNSIPLPTIQRWVARARKQGFLPDYAPKSQRG